LIHRAGNVGKHVRPIHNGPSPRLSLNGGAPLIAPRMCWTVCRTAIPPVDEGPCSLPFQFFDLTREGDRAKIGSTFR
jgi:hypothetical protein